jgi:predicted Zn-dependent peptidase
MTVPVTRIQDAIEILGDILLHSKFTAESVYNEYSTIYSELEHCHEDKWDTLLETSHFTMFRNQVIGQPILGMLNNIRKVNREMVLEFHRRHYCGKNIVITGAGNIGHED